MSEELVVLMVFFVAFVLPCIAAALNILYNGGGVDGSTPISERHIGPNGGCYHITRSGEKVYDTRKKKAARMAAGTEPYNR
jgi:hypothetical protein